MRGAWMRATAVVAALLAACVSGTRAADKEGAMSLGDAAEISLSTPDLKLSAAFYEKLGFKRTGAKRTGKPAGIVLTDGVITLGLYPAKFPSPTLTYFSTDPAAVAEQVKGLGVTVSRLPGKDGRGGVAEFRDPSGLRIVLASAAGIDLPAPLPKLNGGFPKTSIVTGGGFGEFCVKVASAKEAQRFWEGLDFQRIGGSDKGEAYAIMVDGKSIIGLHQTEEFQDPHLTYFHDDADAAVKKLKGAGFSLAKETKDEKGVVNGGVLKGPEGQGLFVF